jgi:toxin YoeB
LKRAEREAVFHREFLEDLRFWVKTDRSAALRTLELVEAALRNPIQRIGKAKALKYVLTGCWSRRITRKHRLVYRVGETRVDLLRARYHY